jgi:hypothetical protein
MMAEMPPERAAKIDPSRQTMFILIFTPINIFISLLIGAGLLWVRPPSRARRGTGLTCSPPT